MVMNPISTQPLEIKLSASISIDDGTFNTALMLVGMKMAELGYKEAIIEQRSGVQDTSITFVTGNAHAVPLTEQAYNKYCKGE